MDKNETLFLKKQVSFCLLFDRGGEKKTLPESTPSLRASSPFVGVARSHLRACFAHINGELASSLDWLLVNLVFSRQTGFSSARKHWL